MKPKLKIDYKPKKFKIQVDKRLPYENLKISERYHLILENKSKTIENIE